MPICEKNNVQIYFEDEGSGYPLLVIPGGGLNSKISFFESHSPFNAITALKDRYRCITPEIRNANDGRSKGPLEIDRPWDAYTDDHLAVMDHLGIKEFMVIGFCIGGPLIWNLLKRAAHRVPAAVLSQPSGFRPELPELAFKDNLTNWGPKLCLERPEITIGMVDAFLTNMYKTQPDFVYTVTRDFVRGCQTPVLIMPDDVPYHPYAVAMEAALLAPNSEVSLYPWKKPLDHIPLAVRHVRTFLQAHQPAA